MSLPIQIRLARPEDIGAVVALERGLESSPHWAEQDYVAMLEWSEIKRRLVVAERREGGLIGFAAGKVIGQALAEIESVAVAVEARRLGVGKALCEAVMSWFRDEGAEAVELEVRAGNDGAIALYQGLGFTAVGRRKMYYREPLDDAVLMSMTLVR